jgi:hypothetical protein
MSHFLATAGDTGRDSVDVRRHLPSTQGGTGSDAVDALPRRFKILRANSVELLLSERRRGWRRQRNRVGRFGSRPPRSQAAYNEFTMIAPEA